ncbi:MAG: hypothetical protein QOJ13_2812 [Gaiellales bacterium]|nr:hypothetical protein [Gaiellales bacterium]
MPAKSTPRPTRPETVKKGHKWCPRCGQVKVHDLFARNKASNDGLYSICKACEAVDRKAKADAKKGAAVEAAKLKRTRSRKAPTA